MDQKHGSSNRLKAFCSLLLVIPLLNANGQILKKIKESAKDLQDVARQVTSTTKEVSTTAKTIKQSWKKDTSRNIKYEQVPDYRNRDEVSISNKQKLSVV